MICLSLFLLLLLFKHQLCHVVPQQPPCHHLTEYFFHSELWVPLEYEIDYSLLSSLPLIWFHVASSTEKDENLSKIGYILFEGATIAAGTGTL